jgi:hypothetical protein
MEITDIMNEKELSEKILELIPKICSTNYEKQTSIRIFESIIKRHNISLKNLTNLYNDAVSLSKKIAKARIAGIVYCIEINHNRFDKSEYAVYWELKAITKPELGMLDAKQHSYDNWVIQGIEATNSYDIDLPECVYEPTLLHYLIAYKGNRTIHLNKLNFKYYDTETLTNILFSIGNFQSIFYTSLETVEISADYVIEELNTLIKGWIQNNIKENNDLVTLKISSLLNHLFMIKVKSELYNLCNKDKTMVTLPERYNLFEELISIIQPVYEKQFKRLTGQDLDDLNRKITREDALRLLNNLYRKTICTKIELVQNTEHEVCSYTKSGKAIAFTDEYRITVYFNQFKIVPDDIKTYDSDIAKLPSEEEALQYW